MRSKVPDRVRGQMHGMRRCVPMVFLAAAVMTLAACAPRTTVTSVRAQDYAGRPQRIFVISPAGMGWGPDFSTAFRAKFQDIVRACNATAAFDELSGLELDRNHSINKAAAFRADTVLSIAAGGGVVDSNGFRLSIVYNTTLGDLAQDRAVWRAKMSFARGSALISLAERGAVFAIELTNGLKKDGILTGCAPIQLEGGARLDASAIPKAPPAGLALPDRNVRTETTAKPSLRDLQDLLPPQ